MVDSNSSNFSDKYLSKDNINNISADPVESIDEIKVQMENSKNQEEEYNSPEEDQPT
jgi:hypothetical protein